MKNIPLLAITLSLCCCPLGVAGALFFGGDAENVGAVGNSAGYMGFDCFTVPAGGWVISSVFSNNQVSPFGSTAIGGTWEIWTNLGSATETLVASGSTVTNYSWTATGRTIPYVGSPEYTLLLYDLNVYLGPGTYWLGVSPFMSDSSEAYISGTGGQNALGSPIGSSGLAVLRYPGGGLAPTTGINPGMFDLSMGINGTEVPEPTAFVPLGTAILAVMLNRRPLRQTRIAFDRAASRLAQRRPEPWVLSWSAEGCGRMPYPIGMSTREVIVHELEWLPEQDLGKLLAFLRSLKEAHAENAMPTLAAESALGRLLRRTQPGPISKGRRRSRQLPFSHLGQTKRRPALVLASLAGDDMIFRQITSQARSDSYSVALEAADFKAGGLNQSSRIRPNREGTRGGEPRRRDSQSGLI